jgi:hypothetical protein
MFEEDTILQEKGNILNIGEIRSTLRFYRELFTRRGITDQQKKILLLEADRLIMLGNNIKKDVGDYNV